MSKLTELKGEVVTLRNRIEKGNPTLQDVLDLNRKRKLIKKFERFFIRTAMWLIVSTVILVSGCNLAREGIYGLGRCVGAVGEDVKWIAEKTADNIATQEK